MTAPAAPLEPALYLVATPIGAARDITLRALDVLGAADVLAAEDTRTLRRLMEIHGIAVGGRPLIAYHDHSGPGVRAKILAALAEGRSVAYASEAGTPLVADPGYRLAEAAIAAGHRVTTAPGPSAALAALAVSGLPTDRFLFAGFLPAGRTARRKAAAELAAVPATLVFYESPKRIRESLGDLCEVLGEARPAAVARELTKRFEEVRRGTLGTLAAGEIVEKGEIVLLVGRGATAAGPEEMEAALRKALETMTVKTAAATVAEELGLPRRQVYQAALAMEKDR